MQKTFNDWIKEFYPVDASNVKGSNKELLEHSLKKWKGATEENTKAYNCVYDNYNIKAKCASSEMKNQDRLALTFGHTTCALCQVHKHEISNVCWAVTESDRMQNSPLPLQIVPIWYDCRNCVIVLSGNPSCPTGDSAYSKSKNDPSPMIALLEKLLQEINKDQS